MSEIRIHTNNVPRDIEYLWEFTPAMQESVRSEYSWMDKDEIETAKFFRYKGNVYALADFMDLHNKVHEPNPPVEFQGWDGYMSDSYFSGVLIKYARMDYNPDEIDTERVVVGWYCS